MIFVARWDWEIEARADYRPKGKVFPEQVWKAIEDIEKITPLNVRHVMYARELLAQCGKEDFQHMF